MVVATDVTVEWDDVSVYLQLFSRSGLFFNHSITCEGGVIDFDFCRPIGVMLLNHGPDYHDISVGDRICQGVFLKKPEVSEWLLCDHSTHEITPFDPFSSLPRNGGFGSTGK